MRKYDKMIVKERDYVMKRLFTGLCMAWGNFCFIPGLKKWDENARSLMLGWLPLIGVVIGGLWALIYFGLVYASLPYLLTTFLIPPNFWWRKGKWWRKVRS